jgi:hypothetical protein
VLVSRGKALPVRKNLEVGGHSLIERCRH